MAATAQPRTGRTHRPRRPDLTRTGLAYQAGRDGDAAPSWIGDDPKLEDAYERGVTDREAAEAGAPPRDPTDRDLHASEAVPVDQSGAGRPTKKRATPRRASGPSTRASRPQGGRRASPFGRPTLTPPRGLSVSDGSGFMLGLVLYAVGLNYLRYGWPGVTQWFAAKFVNHDDLTPEQLLQFSEGPSPKLSRNLVRRAEKHPTFGKGSIFAPGTLGRLPTHVDNGGGR